MGINDCMRPGCETVRRCLYSFIHSSWLLPAHFAAAHIMLAHYVPDIIVEVLCTGELA